MSGQQVTMSCNAAINFQVSQNTHTRVVGPFTPQLSLNIHRACGLHPLNTVLGAVSPIVAVIISWRTTPNMCYTLDAHVIEECVRVVGPFTPYLSLKIHLASVLRPLNIILGAVSPTVAVIMRGHSAGVCARCGTFRHYAP